MIKIVGLILLVFFLLYIAWIMARAYVEFRHISDKQLKKSGFEGNYEDYEKMIKKKREQGKIKKEKTKGKRR